MSSVVATGGSEQRYATCPREIATTLRLWLMEQTFRYCRALGDRPDSPGDWLRAIAALDRVSTTPPLQAFETFSRRLHARLGQQERLTLRLKSRSRCRLNRTPGPDSLARRPPEPPWLEDYLLGVAAELEGEPDPDQALQHYDRVLARSPDSFWGHYRAAVVYFQLQRWSEAAWHLDCCLKQQLKMPPCSSSSPRASVNWDTWMMPFTSAPALGLGPGLREVLPIAHLHPSEPGPDRGAGGRSPGGSSCSAGSVTRGFFRDPPGQGAGNPLPATVPASQRALDLDFDPGFTAQPGDPLVEPEEMQPDELDARANLALTILTKAGTNRLRDNRWPPAAAGAATGDR